MRKYEKGSFNYYQAFADDPPAHRAIERYYMGKEITFIPMAIEDRICIQQSFRGHDDPQEVIARKGTL